MIKHIKLLFLCGLLFNSSLNSILGLLKHVLDVFFCSKYTCCGTETYILPIGSYPVSPKTFKPLSCLDQYNSHNIYNLAMQEILGCFL